MIRTFVFGLLGVLIVVPYALHLVIDSWGGRMLGGGLLLRRQDAILYSYIDRILPVLSGRAIIFIYAFCWALALGIGIKMLYAAWRERPDSGQPVREVLLGLLGRVAVVAALVAGMSALGLDAFCLYPEEGIPLLMSSFGGALGPVFLYFFPMAQLAAYMFMAAALIHAAVAASGFREFARRGAVVLGVTFAVFGALYASAWYFDLGKYLDDVPGVTNRPEPQTLVVLAKDPVEYTVDDGYNDCSVSESYCRRIISSNENTEALQAYLKDRNHMTSLRGAAFSLMALNHLRELNPAGALRVYRDAFVVTGDITQGISAMTRLVYSPATPAYREVLEELSDEQRFTASGRTALRFGKAYARFGELDRARYWHDKGMRTVSRLSDRDRSYFRLTGEPAFNHGSVTGRLSIDGLPAAGVRVGIARSFIQGQLEMARIKSGREIMPFLDLQGITDGTSTDGDGRFYFSGLYEDSYILLLSVEWKPGARYAVTGSPGIISISPASPAVDAGVIRLAASRP